ncbi:hypothetical protein [Brevundimonas sp.]
MFTVYFRNSTTTPSQPGLRTLVDAALDDCGATWTGQEAELALPDGSLFYLFGEDEEDGMLLEYPILSETVAAAVYAIADRSSTFVLDDPFRPSMVRTAGSVGEIRAADMSVGGYDTVDDPEVLHTWLSRLNKTAERRDPPVAPPATKKKSTFEDRSFFGKLADALFGKRI